MCAQWNPRCELVCLRLAIPADSVGRLQKNVDELYFEKVGASRCDVMPGARGNEFFDIDAHQDPPHLLSDHGVLGAVSFCIDDGDYIQY